MIRVHTVCYKVGLWVVMSGKCNLCLCQWLISPYRQTLWTWIRLLLGEQFNPDPHCLLKRLEWNNLAEHKWRFAGVLMMAQHCWLSSFLIFQGILISIAKKPYISYDFSGDGVGGEGALEPLPPTSSGSSHHDYAQLMLDPYHKFLSTTFRRAQ